MAQWRHEARDSRAIAAIRYPCRGRLEWRRHDARGGCGAELLATVRSDRVPGSGGDGLRRAGYLRAGPAVAESTAASALAETGTREPRARGRQVRRSRRQPRFHRAAVLGVPRVQPGGAVLRQLLRGIEGAAAGVGGAGRAVYLFRRSAHGAATGWPVAARPAAARTLARPRPGADRPASAGLAGEGFFPAADVHLL